MKRFFSLLLAMVLVLGILPAAAFAAEAAPQTDADGVYQIGTAQELLWFAETVNSGNTDINAVLTADIDLTEIDWPGIGVSENRFRGSFDGQNHTVKFENAAWGLFRYILGSPQKVAKVSNVRTEGSIKRSGIASNAGYVHFTHCINGATITSSDSYVAGIVGDVAVVRQGNGTMATDVKIVQCGNEASITANENVGGIVGSATANTRIESCYNTRNITGNQNIGGIAGYLQATSGSTYVKSSYNTGTVTCLIQGQKITGGIAGHMHNSVSITNCYNSGISDYAIAGSRFNFTATINNCYYLGINSFKCSPDFFESTHHQYSGLEINTRGISRTAAQMASPDMVSKLSSGFKQSCPTPVLEWQEAVTHTGEDRCANCQLGSTVNESYWVTFQQSSIGGYSIAVPVNGEEKNITGEEKATHGTPFSFVVNIDEGFQMNGFIIKVNGKEYEFTKRNDKTIECTIRAGDINGPQSVTIFGVEQLKDNYAIKHPPLGYGYTIETPSDREDQTKNTVAYDKDYHFALLFKEGFMPGRNFRVVARSVTAGSGVASEVELYPVKTEGKSYHFVIEKVNKNYEIVVSGVAAESSKTVTVNFSISEGYDEFHVAPGTNKRMISVPVTVPYFDLGLYGLEQYYYNPYCYQNEQGIPQGIQRAGTPEGAYDNITLMHAYIVLTELYRLNYKQYQVGQALHLTEDAFRPGAFTSGASDRVISWTQGVGSSFMDFWEHGTNMNYYVDYTYPLGSPGWGSTSDQIVLNGGEEITLHLIKSQASGSRFGLFTVDDPYDSFRQSTPRDEATVYQNQKIELTLYWTDTTGNYDTDYVRGANNYLYWADVDNIPSADVSQWNRTELPKVAVLMNEDDEIPEEDPDQVVPVMKTDENGKILIDTAGVIPGTYYISARGTLTEGGGKDNAGFVSAGAESGPCVFKLTILESDGMPGDLDGDFYVTALDASMVLSAVAGLVEGIDAGAADVDGDGYITALDASLILQYVAGLIDSFPAET